MCFKIISKVVKYTCRLRRYNYTHDQLNTRHHIRIFLGLFFEKGGGAKFKFAPGRQIPSLRHWRGKEGRVHIDITMTRNKFLIINTYISRIVSPPPPHTHLSTPGRHVRSLTVPYCNINIVAPTILLGSTLE